MANDTVFHYRGIAPLRIGEPTSPRTIGAYWNRLLAAEVSEPRAVLNPRSTLRLVERESLAESSRIKAYLLKPRGAVGR